MDNSTPDKKKLDTFLQKLSNTQLPSSPKKDSHTAEPSKSNDGAKQTSSNQSLSHNTSRNKKRPPQKGKTHPPYSTTHDPTVGRPTIAKKASTHPTQFLLPQNAGDIRVVPLGGMEQVGFNMMFVEWGDDIIIIDMGTLFPSAEHLGVDILVPNIEYLLKNKKKIRGVIFTHGHLDHIGGVGYLIQSLGFPPLYGSRLTNELIVANSEEHVDTKKLKLIEITPRSKIKLGRFECEFFHVNHSIPECLGVVLHTPYGAIVHSADFKIDHNPSDEMPADLHRIASIGKKGVALAMVDSTNAIRPGHTLSESVIQKTLDNVVSQTKGRLIITTFASTIGRIARLIESAERHGRTVFFSGRSMERNIAIARKLNYLKCKDKTIQRMSRKVSTLPPDKIMILSTGSQGEELAALTRMAAGIHKDVQLNKDDSIVFSSSPIPGNEIAIVSVLNNLAEIGCRIIDKKELDVYVSGHGHREELKLFTTLINPKYFAPIHGELYMRYAHKDLVVKELGFNPEHAFIMKNGRGIVLNKNGARLMSDKEKVPTGIIMIDLHDPIGEHVMADRKQMSNDGVLLCMIHHTNGTIKSIDIRTRGFVYMGMNHEIFSLLKSELKKSFEPHYSKEKSIKDMEHMLTTVAQKLLIQKFKKEPALEIVIL